MKYIRKNAVNKIIFKILLNKKIFQLIISNFYIVYKLCKYNFNFTINIEYKLIHII
jgi:hypothetical protein